MPMVKDLENFHQELMDIARESKRLSHTKYTSDDVEKLQDRLRSIDSRYNEGTFCGEATPGRYEEEGQAQVVDELEKVHKTLHAMLSRIDN
jgi:GTP1/Obg family GTP-binding protein